ncbi:MAG TPA: hypothetical protein VG268_12095, partial [Streptosporangiaceae bacterium]|nr:hypothetical protein [Streptosporangiaceae bacterium]
TKSDAERSRAAAQRQVDDLTRQKDSISSHLAQLRQLLGGGVPGMEAESTSSVPSAPSRPAISDAPRSPAPAPAAPVQEAPKPANGGAPQAPAQRQAPAQQNQPARSGAPAANGAKQGANGKAADDEDWWPE